MKGRVRLLRKISVESRILAKKSANTPMFDPLFPLLEITFVPQIPFLKSEVFFHSVHSGLISLTSQTLGCRIMALLRVVQGINFVAHFS